MRDLRRIFTGWRRCALATALPITGLAAVVLPLVAATPAGGAAGDTVTLYLSEPYIGIGTTQTVTATVLAQFAGRAESGESATFTSTGGVQFTKNVCTTGSQGTCSVTLTPGPQSGQQTVSVAVSGLAYSGSASAPLLQYGPASAVALSLQHPRLTPNGVSATEATALVTDSSGTPVPAQDVVFSTSAGSGASPVAFGPVSTPTLGTYATTITAPPGIGYPNSAYTMAAAQSATQTITALVSPGGPSGSQNLELASPTLYTVQYPQGPPVSGQPAPGLYDDRGRITLEGGELDIYNDPASDWNDIIDHMGNAAVVKAVQGQDTTGDYWDFDILRVQMDEGSWLAQTSTATPLGCGQDYWQTIDSIVQRATEDGVIVDLNLATDDAPNATGPNSPSAPCNDTSPGENGVPDEGSIPFWESVAQRYGSSSSPEYNPMVVFDVYNEPELVQAADAGMSGGLKYAVAAQGEDPVQAWMNGGTLLQSEGGTSFVGMETLYSTVRTYAPETPVLISGVGPDVTDPTDGSLWAFDLSPVVLGDRVAGTTTPVRITNSDGTVGTNVIYSSHPYWNGGSAGQDCSSSSNVSDGDNSANVNNPNHEGDLTAWIQPVAEQYPVFFGEIGYACDVASQGNNAAEYNITWAQQYGVGWMDFMFERNWDQGPTTTPTWGFLECDIQFCDPTRYSSYASAAYVPYANGTYTYTTSTSTTTLLN